MSERVVAFGQDNHLVGILSEPNGCATGREQVGVLLLNAGRLHRVGPHRLNVNMARRLADSGLRVCRFDFGGLGDSVRTGGESFSLQSGVEDTIETMNFLEQTVGVRKFVLLGICLGADVAFQVAVRDARVAGAFFINGSFFRSGVPPTILDRARRKTLRRYYRKQILSPAKWRRLLSGKSRLWTLLRERVRRSPGPRSSSCVSPHAPTGWEGYSPESWRILSERGAKLRLLYSEGSTYLDLFRLATRPNGPGHDVPSLFRVNILRDIDHTFTLLWSQEILIENVVQWISSEFLDSSDESGRSNT